MGEPVGTTPLPTRRGLSLAVVCFAHDSLNDHHELAKEKNKRSSVEAELLFAYKKAGIVACFEFL